MSTVANFIVFKEQSLKNASVPEQKEQKCLKRK